MNTKVVMILAMAVAVALLAVSREAEAACNPYALAPCASAFTSSSSPSSQCCDKLREQRPCLCQYYRDPNLSQYINSPGARRVASSCSVTVQC